MGPFRKGLSEVGFVEGRNVAIEYRFAQGEYDRLPELAADLVRRQVAVIVTPASIPAALAAKAATKTIPVVFAFSRDPVELGLVASLSRPGGNVTGSASLNAELLAKQLGFLHELLPHAARIAVLINPNNPAALAVTRDVQEAAAGIGGPIDVVHAGTAREIDVAFAKLVQMRTDALLVSSDALFGNRRVQLLTVATHYRLPTIYYSRLYAEAGGLMSYGTNFAEVIRQAGIYVGRILKGEKPADLPVMRPTKFELVINLQTARTLGLTVPPTLLALADEVIE